MFRKSLIRGEAVIFDRKMPSEPPAAGKLPGVFLDNPHFFPKDDYLGVLKSTATTCACVRGRVGVSECGGEVGVGSLGGSRPARNFHFRSFCTSILYLDPVPRSCTSILYPPDSAPTSAENLILSTQRMRGGRSCRKKQFYNRKTHRGRMFFEMGGDLAEKSSFTRVKRIAAQCFLN